MDADLAFNILSIVFWTLLVVGLLLGFMSEFRWEIVFHTSGRHFKGQINRLAPWGILTAASLVAVLASVVDRDYLTMGIFSAIAGYYVWRWSRYIKAHRAEQEAEAEQEGSSYCEHHGVWHASGPEHSCEEWEKTVSEADDEPSSSR